jgi:hypothetical protein
VLKKAGTIVALATAGLLAMSPLALAGDRGNVDVTDQENEQESTQGNGILNGNNVLSGNAVQVCDVNVSALNNVIGAVGALLGAAGAQQVVGTVQGGGDCNNSGTAVGQSTTQDAQNDND